ncbi:heme lyase CcmF/NrfE family subunit [Nonomuraea phyllanthi]|uniref:Heme lyase CcmF/NrfE family subunit n=1 Tax=Nonomuraea phyllanthi TaxID=2219224 RepID=A0A5C4WV54_9ACTN|nr:heme lyase CcmF/NrfE family subunit [Nonomuraea phyllanthi]
MPNSSHHRPATRSAPAPPGDSGEGVLAVQPAVRSRTQAAAGSSAQAAPARRTPHATTCLPVPRSRRLSGTTRPTPAATPMTWGNLSKGGRGGILASCVPPGGDGVRVIGYLGTAALWAGLAASLAAALTWPRARSRPLAARCTACALACAALAFVLLESALVTHDFRIGFVARQGGRDVPLYYTVTSLWSALEGSLVLWLLVLAAFAFAAGRHRSRRAATAGGHHGTDRLQRIAMTTVMLVCAAFFALTALAADPFAAADPVPADGPGPDPLLRGHPLMGVHPPLLYLGYAGLMVPFGYGVACLITGRVEVARIRAWTLVAWIPLTAGIVLGAWWSYGVLGWGGYWEWDPVENASLMPWLVATAVLHAARARSLRAWTVALAVSAFLLVLLGTFLTRSGAVASVHSFTRSAAGPALLGVLTAALVTAAGLIAWRVRRPPSDARPATAPLLGSGLLTALAGTVLLGTLFPLVADLVLGERVSVGAPYFDRMVVPGLLALLALMGAASRRRQRLARPVAGAGSSECGRGLAWPVAAGAATVAGLGSTGRHSVTALLAFGLAAFELAAIAARLLDPAVGRRRMGVLTAHAGVALAAVAVAASSGYAQQAQGRVRVGESLQVGGYDVRLDGVERQAADGAMTAAARVVVTRHGAAVGVLRPSLAFYPARGGSPVARPAIRGGLLSDLYVSVSEVDQDGAAVALRVAVNPLMSLLWASGGLMVLGGLLTLAPTRPRTSPGSALLPTRPRTAPQPASGQGRTPSEAPCESEPSSGSANARASEAGGASRPRKARMP